jgi:hypothetical protein
MVEGFDTNRVPDDCKVLAVCVGEGVVTVYLVNRETQRILQVPAVALYEVQDEFRVAAGPVKFLLILYLAVKYQYAVP